MTLHWILLHNFRDLCKVVPRQYNIPAREVLKIALLRSVFGVNCNELPCQALEWWKWDVRRSWQRQNMRAEVGDPCNGKLCGCDALLLGKRTHRVCVCEIIVKVLSSICERTERGVERQCLPHLIEARKMPAEVVR